MAELALFPDVFLQHARNELAVVTGNSEFSPQFWCSALCDISLVSVALWSCVVTIGETRLWVIIINLQTVREAVRNSYFTTKLL